MGKLVLLEFDDAAKAKAWTDEQLEQVRGPGDTGSLDDEYGIVALADGTRLDVRISHVRNWWD